MLKKDLESRLNSQTWCAAKLLLQFLLNLDNQFVPKHVNRFRQAAQDLERNTR